MTVIIATAAPSTTSASSTVIVCTRGTITTCSIGVAIRAKSIVSGLAAVVAGSSVAIAESLKYKND
jgi:hypothetical protein